jgi:hypothetical protein
VTTKVATPGKLDQHISLRQLAAQWGGSDLHSAATESYLQSLVAANPQLRGRTFALGGHQLVRPVTANQLNAGQQSSFDLLQQTLTDWGLTELIPDLKALILKGDTAPDTLALALSGTDAYKKRFAGNELRKQQGLPQLTPAQYIATEESYRQVLNSYGLPKGFYDQHSDFTNFIGNDLSPAELDARAKVAHDQYMNVPDYAKNLWKQYYGTDGDIIASILNPNVATQLIQDRGQQVGIGSAAEQFGLHINQQRAQQLQQAGITDAQAQQGYSQIGQELGADQSIAQRFGTNFGQTEAENAVLLGDADATNKRKQLYGEEEGLFKGHAGTDAQSLTPNLSSY